MIFSPLFINLRFLDILDIFLVAYLIYALYNLLKGTAAINIFFGIIAIFFIWKLVDALEMELLSEILGAFISVGFIALLVVFQPEIRRFLLLLGTPTFISKHRRKIFNWKINFHEENNCDINAVLAACETMSKSKTGALIVFSRQNELGHYAESGEQINANINKSLIENIFYKNSPLHDGAVIIRQNKIVSAGCVLPLTKNKKFPNGLGLRHRAATGLSEVSDAITIIVSEQTGNLSYTLDGQIKPDVSLNDLKSLLEKELT